MRLYFVTLFVACVLWASASGSVTFANPKTTKVISFHATQPIYANLHQVPSTRLLRIADEEERAPVGGTLPDLVKRGGQKITDSVRVRFWLQQKSKTADKVFTNLKLDGGLEKAIANMNLNTWFTYVELYNKKYPKNKISVTGMFAKTYGGDAVVARALEAAKGLQNTKKMAYKLSRDQINTWMEEGKSIDDVFKLLNLDKAGDDLFSRLELSTWIIYIQKTTGTNPRATAVSILESHYGSAAFAKMLATANPPVRSLKLLATKLENTMVQRWLGGGKSIDEVFVLLKLNESAERLLMNPALKTWMGFGRLYNEKHPDAKVPMLKTLANFFDAKVMSKVLVDGRKDPRTSAVVKELDEDLSLYSKRMEKKIDDN